MIQRFCFVKLADPEVSQRAAIGRALADELRAAGAHAMVGLPADDSAARWDLSLVIECGSLAAWQALAATPAIAAALAALARRAAVVKAWTFEAG